MDASLTPLTDHATIAVYEGAITGINKKSLVGWAWDESRPDEAISIDLFIGDIKVATVTAGAFSQELYLRRKGNGFHQFEAPLAISDAQLSGSGDASEVVMRVSGSDEQVGRPFLLTRETLLSLAAGRRVVGKIEQLRDGKIEGWVADLDFDDAIPSLKLSYDDSAMPISILPQRVNSIVHHGNIITGWRFSAALPTSALDGRVHIIAAHSNLDELEGSPLLVGPSAASDVTNAIGAQAREIADLRNRLAILPGFKSTDALMDDLAKRVLDRVDMLMSIYRDNIEHELGLMRNELVKYATTGGALGNPSPVVALSSVVAPVLKASAGDASLQQEIVFDETLALSSGIVDIKTDGAQIYGLLGDAIELTLPSPVRSGQLIVVEGIGAIRSSELLEWQFSGEDTPFLGRFEIREGGYWRFVGRMVRDEGKGETRILRIAPTSSYTEVLSDEPTLKITRLSLPAGLVRAVNAADLPIAVAEHIAGKINGFGWHAEEIGADGAYRWMGLRAGLRIDLKHGPARKITIIGEDSVPHDVVDGEALQLYANYEQIPMQVRDTQKAMQRWAATVELSEAISGENVLFEFVSGEGVAKSPYDYASISDPRILSFSIRAISWDQTA